MVLVFSAVAMVSANSNSQTEKNYNTQDDQPLQGKSYYRLKMVDIDGSFDYSAVRVVFNSSDPLIKIIGNPVQQSLQVVSSLNEKSEWEIVNKAGQIIKKGMLVQGRTEINVSSLGAGNYWLRTTINRTITTHAFVKL